MDYGKLAYLKAVDLEGRLCGDKKSQFCVVTAKVDSLKSGTNEVISLEGSGDVAVIAKVSDAADFYVDGVKAASGNGDVFFKITDGGKITVNGENEIASLSLMAMGNISASELPGSLYVDYNGQRVCYVICDKGVCSAYVTETSEFMPQKTSEGSYVQGDVCSYGKDFLLAFLNSDGSVKLVYSGNEYVYNLCAQKVAVNADDFSIRLAYIKSGSLYYIEFEKLGSPLPQPKQVAYRGYVDDVRFVRKSTKLLFSSGGKCYIKELNVKGSNKDKMYVNLTAEVE